MSDSAFLGAASANAATLTKDFTTRNDVTVKVGGVAWGGWQSIKITRGVETIPSSFELMGTERYPSTLQKIDIIPGSPCSVFIGADVIITGYIDAYEPRISPTEHSVRIIGRSKCEDLVDCSAKFQSAEISQFSNLTMGQLAKMMAAQFGITVTLVDGDTPVLPTFDIALEETPFEVLDRIGKVYGKLVYDGTDGNLIIAAVGANYHSSGFVEGVNVQEAEGSFGTQDRYTEIDPVLSSTDILVDGAATSTIPWVQNAAATDTSFPKRADGKARYRPLIQVVDTNLLSQGLAETHTRWDIWRRYGRSQRVTITVDTWRDSAGLLWQPNYLASISLPSLKLNQTWLISQVTFWKDEDRGTRAEVELMPSLAFQTEPSVLLPFEWQISQSGSDTTGSQTGPSSNGQG